MLSFKTKPKSIEIDIKRERNFMFMTKLTFLRNKQ